MPKKKGGASRDASRDTSMDKDEDAASISSASSLRINKVETDVAELKSGQDKILAMLQSLTTGPSREASPQAAPPVQPPPQPTSVPKTAHPSPPPAGRLAKKERPDSFDGTKKHSAATFIQELEQILLYFNISKHFWVAELGACFTGAAMLWFQGFQADHATKLSQLSPDASWTRVLDAFMGRFEPNFSLQVVRNFVGRQSLYMSKKDTSAAGLGTYLDAFEHAKALIRLQDEHTFNEATYVVMLFEGLSDMFQTEATTLLMAKPSYHELVNQLRALELLDHRSGPAKDLPFTTACAAIASPAAKPRTQQQHRAKPFHQTPLMQHANFTQIGHHEDGTPKMVGYTADGTGYWEIPHEDDSSDHG